MSFSLKIEAVGDVFSIRGDKDNKKDAKLQFLVENFSEDGEELGSEIVDVKVVGARREDLKKFKGKKVRLKDLKMFKVDFNTYYRVDDISKIEEIK